MTEQLLQLRAVPLVIDTAHGVIKIHRHPEDRRKLRIELPDGLRAHVGMDPVKRRSQWVTVDDEGVVRPKRRAHEVDVDADTGAIKGLVAPRLRAVTTH